MSWETVGVIIGALGGLELIKWSFNAIVNRKNNSRINDAEADASEFKVLQETVLFLQQQLKENSEQYKEQTQMLRHTQKELLASEKEKAEKEVEYLEKIGELELKLAHLRCDDEYCPFRLPPTAKTPPRAGLNKDEYLSKKRNDTAEN